MGSCPLNRNINLNQRGPQRALSMPTPQKRGLHGGAGTGIEPAGLPYNMSTCYQMSYAAPLFPTPHPVWDTSHLIYALMYIALKNTTLLFTLLLSNRTEKHRWPTMKTISECLQSKLSAKKEKYVKTAIQNCQTKYFKPFWLKFFSFAAGVVDTVGGAPWAPNILRILGKL